jgi:lantibiotic modifying enzyme
MSRPVPPETALGTDASPAFLATAASIADALVRQAVWDGDRCNWLGYDMDEEDGAWRAAYRTIDESLYGGLAGVALFLSEAWTQTRDPAHAAAAAGAAREAMRLLRARRSVTTHGWYSGVTGTLWGVRTAARRIPDMGPFDDEDLLQEVLNAPAPEDGAFDLVAGASGTIVGLLAIAGREPTEPVLHACHALADWLLDSARPGPGIGLSWQETTHGTAGAHPLCGLAHGASSAAVALLELWSFCDQPRYRAAVFDTFRYERQWFSRQHCGWPDLRDMGARHPGEQGEASYPTYWCYGAGGTGLARLRAWQLTGDRTALAEANAALFACKARARRALAVMPHDGDDFELNASLCHGLGSVLELLLYAARLGHEPGALALARGLGAALEARALARGEWACGVVGGGETPGLMLGLSGIGALFLGLHDPHCFQPAGLPPSATDG